MSISFKQYLNLIAISEESSDEQINEIFGSFFGKKPETSRDEKLAKLKAERDKLLAAKKAKSQEIDKKWADAKSRIERDEPEKKQVGASFITPSRTTSAAAQGRAAERDWVAGMR